MPGGWIEATIGGRAGPTSRTATLTSPCGRELWLIWQLVDELCLANARAGCAYYHPMATPALARAIPGVSVGMPPRLVGRRHQAPCCASCFSGLACRSVCWLARLTEGAGGRGQVDRGATPTMDLCSRG